MLHIGFFGHGLKKESTLARNTEHGHPLGAGGPAQKTKSAALGAIGALLLWHCAKLPDNIGPETALAVPQGEAGLTLPGDAPQNPATDQNATVAPSPSSAAKTAFIAPSTSFGPPLSIGGTNAVSQPWVTTMPNGTVILVNAENTASNPCTLVFYSSADQGSSWRLAGHLAYPSTMCAYTLLSLSKPAVVGGAPRLLVAYTTCSGNSSTPCTVPVYASDDAGATWAFLTDATQPFATDFCSSSFLEDDMQQIHFFSSANGGTMPNTIMHNISSNAGASFGPNLVAAAMAASPRWPTAAMAGSAGSHNMVLMFERQTGGSNNFFQIATAASTDNGQHWSTPAVSIYSAQGVVPPLQMISPSLCALDPYTLVMSVVLHNTAANTSSSMILYSATNLLQPSWLVSTSLGSTNSLPEVIVPTGDGNLLFVRNKIAVPQIQRAYLSY